MASEPVRTTEDAEEQERQTRILTHPTSVSPESFGKRCCTNHYSVLSRLWIVLQLLTLIVVICGIAVAVKGGSSAYGFLGFYVACLALFTSIVGIVILKKYRNANNHGLLVGLSFMMANVMLINAVIVGTRRVTGNTAAEKALGAFSVFLFAVYVVFTLLLQCWKDEIIQIFDEFEEREQGLELGESDSHAERVNDEDADDEFERKDLKMV